MPQFVETAPPRPRFTKPDGSPLREPKAQRRARETARFERFRGDPWRAYVEDPGFFWQVVGTFALLVFIALFVWYVIKHPPTRFG